MAARHRGDRGARGVHRVADAAARGGAARWWWSTAVVTVRVTAVEGDCDAPSRRCRSGGCPVPRGGSAWSRGAATVRSVRWFRVDPCLVTHVLGAWEEGGGRAPGATTAEVTRAIALRHRAVRLPLRRARSGSAGRSGGLGGGSGGTRPDSDRRRAGRAGTVAAGGRSARADSARRPPGGVSTDGPDPGGRALPLRLRRRVDALSGSPGVLTFYFRFKFKFRFRV